MAIKEGGVRNSRLHMQIERAHYRNQYKIENIDACFIGGAVVYSVK